MTTYSVIGLGKLGASMAAAIASRGHKVIGVDINQHVVEAVNDGHAPVQETNLEETIAANKKRITATLDHREAIRNSDISFVIVPTPSNEQGAFSLQYAAWAFREIGCALAEKNSYHTIVLTSTVLPGSTRHGLLPILEEASGKKCGKDFGLCYSPEFIALGSIIHDFLHPDFTLVGEFDERSGTHLETCYAEIMPDHPPCKRMTLENAELTKISVNSFVTTKISYANMLAALCEQIPGGDIDVVSDALGTDKRIGRQYLTGAIGYGGPCFPRDNVALGYLAQLLESGAELADTTDQLNRSLPKKIIKRIEQYLKKGCTIAVLGLAYKPFSHVIEESHGIYLAQALSRSGYRIIAYDPMSGEMPQNPLGDQGVVLNSIEECLKQADVILITTPDPAFKTIKAEDLLKTHSTMTVIDFWRILKEELSGKMNIRYVPIGCSITDEINSNRLDKLWNGTVQLS